MIDRNWLRKFHLEEQQWLRILVVVAVLGVSSLVVYMVSPRQMRLLLMLFTAAAGALILMRFPHFGLLTLVVGSVLAPIEIGTGTATSIHAAFLILCLLLGLWVLDMVVIRREIQIVPSRPLLPAILFAIAAVLGFLFGQLPWFSGVEGAELLVQIGGLGLYLLSVAAFLLIANQVKEIRWLKWMTYLYVAIGGVYYIGRIVFPLGGFLLPLFQKGATGSVFWTWTTGMAFALALLNRRLKPAYRIVLGLVVIASLYVGFFQTRTWVSGWLPPLLAIITVLALAYPRLGTVVVVGVAVFVLANLDSAFFIRMASNEQYSLLSREEAWILIFDLIKRSPIFGLGPVNYYYYTSLNPIWGWYVTFSSHNQFIDILAQSGLAGLLTFSWFVLALFRLGWSLRKRVGSGFERAYIYGCLGALAGTLFGGMLADWFLPFVYNVTLAGFRSSIFMWLFLGGLVAVEQIYLHGDQEEDS